MRRQYYTAIMPVTHFDEFDVYDELASFGTLELVPDVEFAHYDCDVGFGKCAPFNFACHARETKRDFDRIAKKNSRAIKKALKPMTDPIDNAVKAAGKELAKAEKTLQDAKGSVTKALSKIPYVGAPLNTIFVAVYDVSVGPAIMTMQIAEGKRVDRAVLGHFKDLVRDVKDVGPYAQTVIALIPGVGPGVSGAISAGIALASGKRIDQVLEAAVIGAIPGGPLVAAAYHAAKSGIEAAIKGEKYDVLGAIQSGAGALVQAVGVPPAIANIVASGVSMANQLAKGEPLESAITKGVVGALPVSDTVKSALNEAADISIQLARGRRIDRVLVDRLDHISQFLPVDKATKDVLQAAAATGKAALQGKSIEQTIGVTLQASVTAISSKTGVTVSPVIKDGLKEAAELAAALGAGKRIDSTVVKRLARLSKTLPLDAKTKAAFENTVKTAKGALKGGSLEKSLGVALQSGVGDVVLTHGQKMLPKEARVAVSTAIAVGTAQIHQQERGKQLMAAAPTKLVQTGVELAKSIPAVAEARKLVKGGTKGFDIAAGLTSHRGITKFDVNTVREKLAPKDKLGFDVALSVRTGLVSNKVNRKLSPAAQAGAAIVQGARGMRPDNHLTLLKTVKANPSAAVGAKVAIKDIRTQRENWLQRLMIALGLRTRTGAAGTKAATTLAAPVSLNTAIKLNANAGARTATRTAVRTTARTTATRPLATRLGTRPVKPPVRAAS